MHNPRTALAVGHELPTKTLVSQMSLGISMQQSSSVSQRSAALFQKQLFGRWRGKSRGPLSFRSQIRRQNVKPLPEDLIRWSDGHALVATGSPFAPVSYNGREIPIAQCNNVYIFPAVGLGVIASSARRITDSMMLAAARTLAGNSPALKDPFASLLPPLTDLRRVAADIALAVGIAAQNDGVAAHVTEDELRARVMATQWMPVYA